MSFLNPLLLLGIGTIFVPIIIHLLNRRQFRRVTWAAMRFLKTSIDQNQRRMKLEDLILLALRCLLLALLALALARPTLPWLKSQLLGAKVASVVILDNSASMATINGDQSRLTLAKQAVAVYIEGLPLGSSASILSVSGVETQRTSNLSHAKSVAQDVPQSGQVLDILGVLSEAHKQIRKSGAVEKEVQMFTDGQAANWDSFDEVIRKMEEIRQDAEISIILTGKEAAANQSIDRLGLVSAIPSLNQPVTFQVDITNHETSETYDIPVQLEVNSQPIGEPWIIHSLPAGKTESLTFHAPLTIPGQNRVTVLLPGDSLPIDDRRTIIVNARRKVQVLLVDGDPGNIDTEAETFFLRLALVPVTSEQIDQYPVKPIVIRPSEIETSDLDQVTSIVLTNVADLPQSAAAKLTSFVQAGGGLIYFPGNNTQSEIDNALLGERHGLLPAKLGQAQSPENPVTLSDKAEAIEFQSKTGLSQAKFWTYLELQPEEGARTLLKFSDGAPALVEGDVGRGRVLVFASTCDPAWNDFCVKPAYVPFNHQLLGKLLLNDNQSANLRAGESFNAFVDSELAGREVTVYPTNDPEALGHLSKVELDGEKGLIRYAETTRVGGYQVSFANSQTAFQFAVQHDKVESSRPTLPREQLARLENVATVVRLAPEQMEKGFIGTQRAGSELWILGVMLVGLIGLVEMVLAQKFSEPK